MVIVTYAGTQGQPLSVPVEGDHEEVPGASPRLANHPINKLRAALPSLSISNPSTLIMKALQLLFKTNDNTAPLIARLMLGIVMFPHGAQKMLGWLGGYGALGLIAGFSAAWRPSASPRSWSSPS